MFVEQKLQSGEWMLPHNGSHTWSIYVDFEAADARGESFRLCGGVGAATQS